MILNEPLWILAVAPSECDAATIPKTPLSTLTDGTVEIPSEMLSELSMSPDPSAVLVNPTCSTFINSLSIFRISAVNIEPIPLNANWDVAAPILPSKVCVIDVNVIGCWVTPSNPRIVFVSCWVIVNLCALPAPTPVNVIATPAVISALVGNNWNSFSSLTLTKTVEGNMSVVTPAKFTVDAIDTGVAAIPTKVDPSS